MNAVAQPAAARTAARRAAARPSFPGTLRAELLKLGRQWLTWALLAGFAGVFVVVTLVFALSDSTRNQLAHSPAAFYFGYLTAMQDTFTTMSGIVLLVAGSRLVSMEYGSGTIRVVLARGTSRLGLLLAQYAALAILAVALLAVFVAAAAISLGAMLLAWQGSLSPITSLPGVAWSDTWRELLVAGVSVAVCIALGTGAAVLGRSAAFGVGAALAFFPADNFGTIVMALLTRLTHLTAFRDVTQFFLGPALNQLPASLQTDHAVRPAFAPPLVQVDATHCALVIAAYLLVFIAGPVFLAWRRDVLH